jgi:hypothetical protein
MFTGPMPMDWFDILGVKLVEGRIIQDQNAVVFTDQGLDFAVEGFRIGSEPMQQARVSIVSWRIVGWWLTACRFTATRGSRSRDQKV